MPGDASIKVNTQELASHATQLGAGVADLESVMSRYQAAANDLEARINTVKGQVATLSGEWISSSASGAYQNVMASWNNNSQQVHSALEELKTGPLTRMHQDLQQLEVQVTKAGGTYQETEQGVTGLFGGR
ncbi:MAG: WXG100 family type VII secretion target [Candidatus Dormibacteria bacterium]